MSDSIRVVAPCGCEYEWQGLCWVLPDVSLCRWPHSMLVLDNILREEHVPVVRAGYAIAASQGRGPWAKSWPGKP